MKTDIPDWLVTAEDFAKKLGVTKQAIYSAVRRGVIPKPMKIGNRLCVWDHSIVESIRLDRVNKKLMRIASLREELIRVEAFYKRGLGR